MNNSAVLFSRHCDDRTAVDTTDFTLSFLTTVRKIEKWVFLSKLISNSSWGQRRSFICFNYHDLL